MGEHTARSSVAHAVDPSEDMIYATEDDFVAVAKSIREATLKSGEAPNGQSQVGQELDDRLLWAGKHAAELGFPRVAEALGVRD